LEEITRMFVFEAVGKRSMKSAVTAATVLEAERQQAERRAEQPAREQGTNSDHATGAGTWFPPAHNPIRAAYGRGWSRCAPEFFSSCRPRKPPIFDKEYVHACETGLSDIGL
jgi:hypothetical protein